MLTTDNNVMHAKPDLRVFLKWMIYCSGSVITDVILLKEFPYETLVAFSQFADLFYRLQPGTPKRDASQH